MKVLRDDTKFNTLGPNYLSYKCYNKYKNAPIAFISILYTIKHGVSCEILSGRQIP